MNNLIAKRIAELPIAEGERTQALGYLASGDAIAEAILAIINLFQPAQHAPADLKPSH